MPRTTTASHSTELGVRVRHDMLPTANFLSADSAFLAVHVDRPSHMAAVARVDGGCRRCGVARSHADRQSPRAASAVAVLVARGHRLRAVRSVVGGPAEIHRLAASRAARSAPAARRIGARVCPGRSRGAEDQPHLLRRTHLPGHRAEPQRSPARADVQRRHRRIRRAPVLAGRVQQGAVRVSLPSQPGLSPDRRARGDRLQGQRGGRRAAGLDRVSPHDHAHRTARGGRSRRAHRGAHPRTAPLVAFGGGRAVGGARVRVCRSHRSRVRAPAFDARRCCGRSWPGRSPSSSGRRPCSSRR